MALAQAVACLLAAAVLALTLVWILYYDEGMSLHRSRSGHTGALFNLHPLFMTLAYVVAMPLAALQYRHPIARAWRHSTRKALHASLHTLALVALLLGLAAVVASKLLNVPAHAHMYTMHSYIGATTILLSLVQFGLGIGYYWWSPAAKASLSQIHRPLGFAITVAGLTTVLTGFNEEQALSTKPDANRYAGKVVIISVIGLAVLLLLITVVSALTADERNQDTSEQAPAQFAVVPAGKANCHASVQAAPV